MSPRQRFPIAPALDLADVVFGAERQHFGGETRTIDVFAVSAEICVGGYTGYVYIGRLRRKRSRGGWEFRVAQAGGYFAKGLPPDPDLRAQKRRVEQLARKVFHPEGMPVSRSASP